MERTRISAARFQLVKCSSRVEFDPKCVVRTCWHSIPWRDICIEGFCLNVEPCGAYLLHYCFTRGKDQPTTSETWNKRDEAWWSMMKLWDKAPGRKWLPFLIWKPSPTTGPQLNCVGWGISGSFHPSPPQSQGVFRLLRVGRLVRVVRVVRVVKFFRSLRMRECRWGLVSKKAVLVSVFGVSFWGSRQRK